MSVAITPTQYLNKGMRERAPSVLDPMVRAAGYALTSLCAHFSGYLLQASPRSAGDTFLVLALWATTLPFFLDYAISYHTEDHLGLEDQEPARWARSNARTILPLGVILFTSLLLVCHYAYTKTTPSSIYWIVLVLFALGFFSYGRYTIRRAKLGSTIIRHQLVWPVIFSIALPLYSGIIFSQPRQEILIFAPVVFLVIYFLASLKLQSRHFVFVSLSLFAVVITLRVLGLDKIVSHFSEMAFYLSIAAYLAVFEAWGIAASLASRENSVSGSDSSSTSSSLSSRYYLATFMALSIAALTLPMLYVFSDYGRLFFWGASIHALLAFLTWFWAGGDSSRLRSPQWVIWKTILGFLFLTVIVLDAFFQIFPTKRSLANLVAPGTLTGSMSLSILAMSYRYRQDKESDLGGWIRRLHMSRSGVLVLTVLLSLVMAIGILVVEGLEAPDNLVLFKSDRVFMFYIIAVLLCSALLLFKGGARLLRRMAGLIISARLFTSTTIIGLVVLLSALRSRIDIQQSMLDSLPFFLASAGGFLLNDACDYDRDLLNKPFRPLPRGLVGQKAARITGFILVLLAAVSIVLGARSSFVGWGTQLAVVIGVLSYNPLVARAGWLKGPFTALLCVLPLIFVVVVYGYPTIFWWVILGGYLFCVGRELLMDVLDIKGDSETGLMTLPMLIGVTPSEFVSLTISVMSAVALLVFRNSSKVFLQRGEIDLALAGLVILCLLWWKSRSQERRRQIIHWSRVPLLLAIAVFI